MSEHNHLLEIDELKTHFRTEDGTVKAVDGVSLTVNKGETMALVGESGSGKSVTSLTIMRLINGIHGGSVMFDGENLLTKTERQMSKIRGNKISMIFQEPMTSLNPAFTVGRQISEAVMLHQQKSKRAALKRSIEMLELVGIPEPSKRVNEYPHQLSGGMRQRVMIAIALSCNPELLIADEPTTALDVTIQSQILSLMSDLQAEIGMAILFITHDLSVVAEISDRVAVMYAGRIVEMADVETLYSQPRMPYTLGLMQSIPKINRGDRQSSKLIPIPGNVPNPLHEKPGCPFYARCLYGDSSCTKALPPLEEIADGHLARCYKWNEVNGIAETGVSK